jgi:lactate permease
MPLSEMAGRQLPFFSLIVPVWLVWVMAGWRNTLAVWPALLVCGGSFAIVQALVANFHGPTLVDIAAGLCSLVCLALFLRVWQPGETWHFAGDRAPNQDSTEPPSPAEALRPASAYSRRAVFAAWMPWLFLTVMVFVWGLPKVKKELDEPTALKWEVPALHLAIARDRPVVAERRVEEAVFQFNWLSATGTGIFLASIASAVWMRVSLRRFLRVFAVTLYRLRWPLFTIACMLAIAHVTRYSGMDATLGLAFTKTGWSYPFFAALLGWLGVALTGSDTSSNALFGSLQQITANQLGLSPILICTANSTGGVMGKMIDAQSIVVAAAATRQSGQEGPILRYVFWHSLALAALLGLLVLVQAYLTPWMVPR